MSPKETLDSSDNEDPDSSPPDVHSLSSTLPASFPSLSATQPRDVASATASPVPSPSRSRGDSSPSLPGTPFFSYTSISEGNSDEDDSEDEEDWPAVVFGGNLNDHDSDDYDSDSDDDYSEDEDEPTDEGFGPFLSRYTRWPDFYGPVDEYTHVIIESKEAAEWDIGSDPLHEGPRYPGMDAFRLTGYPFDYRSEPGDQKPEDTFYLDDDDDDDEYNYEWDIESDSVTEAEWWGGGMWIVHYDPCSFEPVS